MPHASSVLKVHISLNRLALQDAVTFLASTEHHGEAERHWVRCALCLPPSLLTARFSAPVVSLGRVEAKQGPVYPLGGTDISSSNSGMASTLVPSRV